MTPILAKLDELKALCDAATPGPLECWAGTGLPPYIKWPVIQKGKNVHGYPEEQDWLASFLFPKDQEFFAASRTAMPQLVEALRVAVEKLEDAADVRGRDSWAHQTLAKIQAILEGK